MNELFELLGRALPDTPTILRLKVLVAGGIGGLAAGVLYMASGLDGSLIRGGLIAACGLALIAITIRSFARAASKGEWGDSQIRG
jgi:hypothetical protein